MIGSGVALQCLDNEKLNRNRSNNWSLRAVGSIPGKGEKL